MLTKMIDGCVLIPASRTLNFYACVSYLARLTLTGTNSDVFRLSEKLCPRQRERLLQFDEDGMEERGSTREEPT